MGEMIADGAEFSCTLCDTKIKMIVPSCSTTGDGKKIANKGNHILLPAPMCKINPAAPPPCVPSVTITDPGQSPNDIDNVKGLGKGCKGICARGGSLSLSDPAQKVFQHDGAGGAGAIAVISGAVVDAATSGGGGDDDDQKKKEEEKKENNLNNNSEKPASSEEKIDAIIKETNEGKGHFSSKHEVSADEALDLGKKHLGDGYKEIGKKNSGVFRSKDNTKQFRIDNASLDGNHNPMKPHVHLERIGPDGKTIIANNHIKFYE